MNIFILRGHFREFFGMTCAQRSGQLLRPLLGASSDEGLTFRPEGRRRQRFRPDFFMTTAITGCFTRTNVYTRQETEQMSFSSLSLAPPAGIAALPEIDRHKLHEPEDARTSRHPNIRK